MTSQPQDDDADRTMESGDADLSEQRADVASEGGDWTRRGRLAAEDEVSEADAVEQLREVELDEDEYR